LEEKKNKAAQESARQEKQEEKERLPFHLENDD
jgi:hypothetical protein